MMLPLNLHHLSFHDVHKSGPTTYNSTTTDQFSQHCTGVCTCTLTFKRDDCSLMPW